MTDDLRDRLRRADPAPRALSSPSSPRAAELLERAMATTAPNPPTTSRRDRRAPWAAAAAAAVLLAGGVGYALTQGGEDSTGDALRLALPGGGTTVASCAGFEVATLRNMSPAFAGTATSVGEREIVLSVDRWYAGGDVEQVVLETPDPTTSAALDGVQFAEGERYLVTASEGTVNGCGYSGPATPELEAAFDEAF